MFDLEPEIQKWRAGLEAAGIPPGPAAEFESHLRDDMARSSKDGLGAKTAFELAKWHLGRPAEIKRELDLAVPASIDRRGPIAFVGRQWIKILTSTVVGIAVGLGLYAVFSAPFQSEAKLYVRYLIIDGPRPFSPDSTKTPDHRGATILGAEMEFITSFDLAESVARSIGSERILAKVGGGNELKRAAMEVHRGLQVEITPMSPVLRISFQHPDPMVVQDTLRELVWQYLRLHLAAHRGQPTSGLDVERFSNISAIQNPTPASRDQSSAWAAFAWAICAGILGGLIWAAKSDRTSRPPGPPQEQKPSEYGEAAV